MWTCSPPSEGIVGHSAKGGRQPDIPGSRPACGEGAPALAPIAAAITGDPASISPFSSTLCRFVPTPPSHSSSHPESAWQHLIVNLCPTSAGSPLQAGRSDIVSRMKQAVDLSSACLEQSDHFILGDFLFLHGLVELPAMTSLTGVALMPRGLLLRKSRTATCLRLSGKAAVPHSAWPTC